MPVGYDNSFAVFASVNDVPKTNKTCSSNLYNPLGGRRNTDAAELYSFPKNGNGA